MRPEELAALLAGGEWLSTSDSTYESTPPPRTAKPSSDTQGFNRDKILLSLERRLRDVPQLERIALLNELIAVAVEELASGRAPSS